MLNKLCAFIKQQNMIQPGDHILCAVSGGADSVALVFALYLLKEKLQIQLSAAHFNHGLRSEESDRDEAFVRRLCDRFDIPLYVKKDYVVPGDKGLEAAAREARYRFLRTLPGKLATAHTANDNAETVLMHLVRGTGLSGLCGITPVGDNLIRPMLTVTRAEVEAFLQEYCLEHVTDSSNATDQFLRNRLRHHVLPLLEGENPRLAENLSAMALLLRQDATALEQLAQEQYTLQVSALRSMQPALRSRILERFLKEHGLPEPERTHFNLVQSVVFSANPSARVCLPCGITVARCYDTLQVLQPQETWQPLPVAVPGITSIPHLGLRLVCDEEGPGYRLLPQGNVVLRPRQSGDTIHLPGGSKTLKKLFIDRKIPAALRGNVPVLADEAGVLAVYGIGVDQKRQCGEGGWYVRFEEISQGDAREQDEGEFDH